MALLPIFFVFLHCFFAMCKSGLYFLGISCIMGKSGRCRIGGDRDETVGFSAFGAKRSADGGV